MSQFHLKSEPNDEYKHILVQDTRSAIICGFSCFTVSKSKTYTAEKLDMTRPEGDRLVPFSITGLEIFENYEFHGDPSLINYAD